jgi:hypothetical protein
MLKVLRPHAVEATGRRSAAGRFNRREAQRSQASQRVPAHGAILTVDYAALPPLPLCANSKSAALSCAWLSRLIKATSDVPACNRSCATARHF